MITQLVDVFTLPDAVPRIARRPVAFVTRTKHAVKVAYEMKKVQFLPTYEQFLYVRSHEPVAGHGAGEPRSEAKLRNLDINDVGSAPVVYRTIAASQDDDFIRVCPVRKRTLLEFEAAQSFITALVAGTSEVLGLGRKLLALFVVIVIIRYDLIAKRFGGIPGHCIELTRNTDIMTDLEELCGVFGLETELGVDAVHLRNVLLQQKILPALYFERNIVAATLEKEWHCGPPFIEQ